MQEAIPDMKHSKSDEQTAMELGARLRRAREAAHLSQQEVAQRLRLKLSVIAAIENDQYGALPAPTFVKGYLRMYCRLVAIPADEIIQVYSQYEDSKATNLTTPVSLERSSKRSGGKGLKYLIVVILFALASMVVRWLYLQSTATTIQPVVATPPPAPLTPVNTFTDTIIKIEPEAAPAQQDDESEDD